MISEVREFFAEIEIKASPCPVNSNSSRVYNAIIMCEAGLHDIHIHYGSNALSEVHILDFGKRSQKRATPAVRFLVFESLRSSSRKATLR
jgi:hypothetical protein